MGKASNEKTSHVATKAKLGRNYLKLVGAGGISNLGDGVGLLAYPWLATAVTRSPVLIAAVAVARGLPWLLFSLPAGIIVDRSDHKRLMITSNAVRTVVTMAVVAGVLFARDLPHPDDVAGIELPGNLGLYILLLVATLLLGTAEVFYDSTTVAFVPAVVDKNNLEDANGRMWSVEQVANSFVGPPLGALLLSSGFVAALVFDALSFAFAGALIASISIGHPRTKGALVQGASVESAQSWRTDLREGIVWLRGHELLWPLALTLGACNFMASATMASYVLFAQEVLDVSTTEFAILGTAGALGGAVGGWLASKIITKLGSGPTLNGAILVGGITSAAIGLSGTWPAVWVFLAIQVLMFTVWNVLTVSLRQRIIPPRLLGRVNSVYRFFGIGMAPFGAALGGLTVVVVESSVDREWGLRAPWLFVALSYAGVLCYSIPRLTTAAIDNAEEAAQG